MDNEKFNPVPHTREDDAKLFADPAFKAAWDALEEEYAALGEMLNARKDAGLTQEAVAERMGTTKSAVCRRRGRYATRRVRHPSRPCASTPMHAERN